ncbi:winged helix DNA-binding domain-containing protein [Aestuariirhabdus sp. Z084]|uniref:winged helix-turn-helix domain-containing protein n=1 Tax=Aestuariirhabdus haliotis TaxID=2918751 RepID=UPI00201B3798|nr:crosslink repair DNA glycosylase YcaQ family protein [Aestuariirhabdus haliotis]MCL6415696.1 winged helix DNA-binding domain-containing protein [Aestuariirhabdus haliotis]MCL6419778.1 winged helix DNA-binding domain-containing protein [Aestuariirhabdus haliotis]
MPPIILTRPQDLSRLRRLALSAQGLLQAQPFGRGLAGARKAISHLGYIQIDTISVVERAHHHVIYSRVPNYKPAMTNRMLLDGDIFEYWAHAAAFIPIADYRFSLPYKQAIKKGRVHWYKNPDQKLMAELLSRIRSDGPLRSRDIETSTGQRGDWWDWKPAKKALEQLYMQGDLMVCDRTGFQKTYDLTERVLPSHIDSSLPTAEEFAAHLVDHQLACHGLVSLKGFTYLRRDNKLRQTVKQLVQKRLTQGSLEQFQLTNGERFLLESGAFERPKPRVSNRLLILSPFDNAVIQRERLKALFQFDYQLECYVPAAKRQHGYFSLPLLYRDEFIGRMDCKAHRKSRHLEIKSLHFEDKPFDQEAVIDVFASAIQSFCLFQNCDSASLLDHPPTGIHRQLQRAIKRL